MLTSQKCLDTQIIKQNHRQITIALYLNSKGFGYVVIEEPIVFLDYGIATVRPMCTNEVLKRIQKMVDFYQPQQVITLDLKGKKNKHLPKETKVEECGTKIIQLLKKANNMNNQKIRVYQYSREQIRFAFREFGAVSKYEIALKIIEWFEELSRKTPRFRKPWMCEDYNMGLFDALSLIITHQYLTS
jgi:hypothetical protein